jgi:hypothetical protein
MITAKMVFAKLGFMNSVRYELGKRDPEVAYDLVKVPTGVEIVRSDPVEPVVVVPEVKLDVQDVFQDTYPVRSITPSQLRIWVSGVKRCVEKKEVLGFSVIDDGQKVMINMSLAAAKKKGLVA